jgi:hypothetical protein
MTLEGRLVLLAQAVGADVKALTLAQGGLGTLTTSNQSNLVAAVNEIHAAFNARLNDASSTSSVTEVWSAAKVTAVVDAAKIAVTNSLVDGAASALDTLNELAVALGNDANFVTTMTTALGNRLRYDAEQTLTAPQKVQGCANLGAVALADLGNFDADFSSSYAVAKA